MAIITTLKITIAKAYHSSTLMTWLSYGTKMLSIIGVLPLVLKKFSAEDIVLWQLFATLILLQSLADFGFRQTFSRVISYAFAGAESININVNKSKLKIEANGSPNIFLLGQITAVMRFIYKRLTIILFVFLILFGSYYLKGAIENSSSQRDSWISLSVIILVTCFSFYFKIYLNFLEGLFKIALVRRVESLTSLGSIFSSLAVLIISPTLLNLIIANQIWIVIGCIRDKYLCSRVENGIFRKVSDNVEVDRKLIKDIWKPAWRSGFSGLMSNGVTSITTIVYSQIGDTLSVASFLLAFRIINHIRDFSMAPFYSKIPLLNTLRINGSDSQFINVVKRGMLLSHLTFFIGAISVGLLSTSLLDFIDSNVPFVDIKFWCLLSFAFFFHRFGAMHLQVHLTTNVVISHIADGISGVIYLLSVFFLVNQYGLLGIPLAMIVSYLGFYCWYVCYYSYKSMRTTFFAFEKDVLLPALLLSSIIAAVIYVVTQVKFDKLV